MTTNHIEFERKFLVRAEALAGLLARAHHDEEIQQGYFIKDNERCVRIRQQGNEYVLALKHKTGDVGKVIEIETPLEAEKAQVLLALCSSRVHKRRYLVAEGEWLVEVDVYLDHNKGFVLAEIELASDEASARLSVALPTWAEREVTGQPEYFNTWLADNKVAPQ